MNNLLLLFVLANLVPEARDYPNVFGRSRLALADGLGRFIAACSLVFSLELIYTTGRIDQLLLSGEEGVAAGTDFHTDIAFVRGTRCERVATGANDIQFVVGRVNTDFHGDLS
jgi:hypothetical protein